MQHIKLICVGKMREKFYMEAFQEYAKRLSAYCRFECVELNEYRLPDNPSPAEIAAALEREALEIEKQSSGFHTVCMCVEGQMISSEQLSDMIQKIRISSNADLCFIIGGSYGLAKRIKDRAEYRISMSRMTFPHHLARVILSEQIYRAFKISEGSKYHK